jgi:hypothetical protein
MNIKYNIIKKNNNICFICLDKIDYYIKLNCECHNYLHQNCIKNIFIKKCFICHKQTNIENVLSNNYELIFIDINFVSNIIEKIKIQNILDLAYDFFQKKPSFFGFVIYIITSFFFSFLIIFPLLILSVLLNFVNALKNNNYINNLIIFIFKNIICLILTSIILPYILNNIVDKKI